MKLMLSADQGFFKGKSTNWADFDLKLKKRTETRFFLYFTPVFIA